MSLWKRISNLGRGMWKTRSRDDLGPLERAALEEELRNTRRKPRRAVVSKPTSEPTAPSPESAEQDQQASEFPEYPEVKKTL